MKRLVLIVEGESEEGFANQVLFPYLRGKGINYTMQCFKIKPSNGGLSKYTHIRKDILHTLHENEVVVSMMVDFYRLPSDFPGFKALRAMQMPHQELVKELEIKLKEDIDETKDRASGYFIPYIQLHEFETLVFAAIEGIDCWFEKERIKKEATLKNVLLEYPNPEDINNHPDTAPSVRLKKHIPGYRKVDDGIGISFKLWASTAY